MTAEERRERAREIADNWPRLSIEQLNRLAALLPQPEGQCAA